MLCIEQLRNVLRREHLQSKARELGFVQRSSKLTGEAFILLLLYCNSLEDCCSLNYMCSILEESFGIKLRKQSLDSRFNEPCLEFVKFLLTELLEEQIQSSSLYQGDFWKEFTHVRIKDSTKFKVPDNMREEFKGNGGSLAGICIQYEYDLASGKILEINVGSGGGNDMTDASKTRDLVQKGDLVIRDLGYYSLDVFETFSRNEAFFLSRLQPKTSVYSMIKGKKEKVDFGAIYRKMKESDLEQIELEVVLGGKYQIPVRMVLSLAEEEVYQKRVRQREQENRKRGQQMSDETRRRYRFNIYITNASKEQLPTKQIFSAYRLRWQIELIFKYWKSLYKVNIGRKMSQCRYLCMLYAKLILIVINLQITRFLRLDIQRKDKDGYIQFLSIQKVLFTLRKRFCQILYALTDKIKKVRNILQSLVQIISENHWIETKKNKKNQSKINELIL